MERRDFIRLSVAGAGAGLAAPTLLLAESHKPVPPAADIYFTKEAPGRWAGKEAGHLPFVEVTRTGEGASIKVITSHEMKAYEHYIVKHVLLDRNFKFMNEHLFDPSKDSLAISTYTLTGYKGIVYALSMCNKHDVWVGSAEI